MYTCVYVCICVCACARVHVCMCVLEIALKISNMLFNCSMMELSPQPSCTSVITGYVQLCQDSGHFALDSRAPCHNLLMVERKSDTHWWLLLRQGMPHFCHLMGQNKSSDNCGGRRSCLCLQVYGDTLTILLQGIKWFLLCKRASHRACGAQRSSGTSLLLWFSTRG